MSSVSIRRRAALLVLAATASCGDVGRLTAPGPSEARIVAPANDPIIFVHGYNGSVFTFSTMVGRFRTDGWTSAELVNWSYDYRQSNVTTARQLGAKIDQVLAATGASRVDIVTHSMGALSARYYVRNVLPAGDRRVDAVVSLAGTNHGTASSFLCSSAACREMRPFSSFLINLNSIDETWGTPRYATWWSPCDEVIYPQRSATLAGATNTQTGCIRHSDLHQSAHVYAQVRDFVKQPLFALR